MLGISIGDQKIPDSFFVIFCSDFISKYSFHVNLHSVAVPLAIQIAMKDFLSRCIHIMPGVKGRNKNVSSDVIVSIRKGNVKWQDKEENSPCEIC